MSRRFQISLRIQIFSIIIGLAVFTVIAGIGSGAYLMLSRIILLEEGYLRIIADTADALFSSKADFLKSYTAAIAAEIAQSDEENVNSILQKGIDVQFGFHDKRAHFTALTIVEKTGEGDHGNYTIVASEGTSPLSQRELSHNPDYIQKSFNGLFVISTTVEKGTTNEGEPNLVFFVCVPMEPSREGNPRVLCAALYGMYFVDVVNELRNWDKGDVVLCDGEGTVIATTVPNITPRRINFIKLAQEHPEVYDFQTLAQFFSLMIHGDNQGIREGRNIHVLYGQERVGYYRPLSGSRMNWALAVTAPTFSSPFRAAMQGIIVIALVCLAISCILAFFASGYILKPFKEAVSARELAETASRSKSHFLANMSHEMRTPLNAIIGLSELAIGSEEAKRDLATNLDKIYSAGMTLLSIINDLLDISKIEAGKLELIPVKYDVPSMINDTAVLNSVRIGSKPIQFTIDVDENLPCNVYGDELRVKQMLNNLLSNAFKYTQEGSVNWSITGKREKDDFFIIFKIMDTGLGIKKEDMSGLFQEYHQFDSKANRRIEGTGLGLALVKKMTALMGGTISVESEYGKGSTFTLQIPQKALSEETIGREVAYNLMHLQFSQIRLARNSRLFHVKLPYARVLVVDDVQTNLDVTRGMLKQYEMHVDCLLSGQEAIDAIRNEKVRYNAIFMDHMMPGMDGIETTRRIREIGTEYAMNVPILALTANAVVGNEEMFLKNGFQAFLSKPIDIMRLDTEIRRWVRDRSQEFGISSGTTLPPSIVFSEIEPTWKIEGVNRAKALMQFGDNEETYFLVLKSFVENTPGLLDKIRACTELQPKDYTLLVHGIKGACYGICADTVGKQAENLEHAANQGNFQYVSEHNATLIEAAEELIEHIKAVLHEVNHLG